MALAATGKAVVVSGLDGGKITNCKLPEQDLKVGEIFEFSVAAPSFKELRQVQNLKVEKI